MSQVTKSGVFMVGMVFAIGALGGYDFILHRQVTVLTNQVASGTSANQVNAVADRVDDLETALKAVKIDLVNSTPHTDFVAAQQATSSKFESIEQKVASLGVQPVEDVVALKAKVEGFESELHNLQKQQPGVVPKPNEKVVAVVHRTPKKPVILAPPFQVIGVESRGSERFLAVAPPGSTRLDEIQLIRPGDTQQAWRLDSLDGTSAQFMVNGIEQVIVVR